VTVLAHDWYPDEVPDNVRIGERTWLHSSIAFLHHRSARDPSVRIGHDCGVYHGTYLDLGREGEVEIGNYVSISGAVFSTNGYIGVGDFTFIAWGVILADSFAAIPPDASIAPAEKELRSREPRSRIAIGANVWIGTRAILLAGADLGTGAVVGAGTVVDHKVPAYAIVAGNPARIVGRAGAPSDHGSSA
jgi:acetyltransferase-like isoleucine patch superfamily enzyme